MDEHVLISERGCMFISRDGYVSHCEMEYNLKCADQLDGLNIRFRKLHLKAKVIGM